MEFNEKLQELRKARSLTQEELAEALFVSRTAISKWESGRGYPSLDSLKEISKFFSVSIDDLICSEEIISAAEDEKKDCMDLINNHIKDIGWKNMRFETLTYNEEKDKIKDSDLKEEFCRRYFFN